MATITIWSGYRTPAGYIDYESVVYENAIEIGSARFEEEGEVIQVRIIETEDGEIIIHHVTRQIYETAAKIFEYPSLEAAAKEHNFILRKAGVI